MNKENEEEMKKGTENEGTPTPAETEMMTESGESETASSEIEDSARENEDSSAEKDELSQLEDKYNDLNDKFLRLYSEFDNFRKRTQKEKLELYKSAGEDILESMLPVLDNLDRAMKSIEESKDLGSLKQGVELIRDNLYNVLSQKGLKAMESSVNKEFNVDYHEAITRVPAPDKKLKGRVIDEIEKGYMLHDKVIRYAKVVIGE